MLLRPLITRSVIIRSTLAALSLSLLMPCAYAGTPTSADIQSQLQAEWSDFTTRVGSTTNTGTINVVQSGAGYKASLPALAIKLQDKNTVRLEGVTILATPSAAGDVNLKITLPTTIPQYYNTQQTGSLSIGKQDLNIAIKPAGDTWQVQSVNGQLGGLYWKQNDNITSNPKAPVAASIGQMSLVGKPNELQLKINDLKTTDTGSNSQTISQIILTQQPSTAHSLRLSDVLVLLTNTLPQLESGQGGMAPWLEGAAGLTADIRNAKNVNSEGKTTLGFDSFLLKNTLIGITDGKMSLRSIGTVKGIEIAAPAAFASTVPNTMDFTTTLRNLPANYFSMPFNTPAAKEQVRAVLANAKSQLQIDSLDITAKGGLKASGTGLLTATMAAPTYVTGNIMLNLTNLQETMLKLQTQKSGNQSQAIMAMMLLQGMGKHSTTDQNLTQYALDFQPNGMILLNGQDLSGLLSLGGLGKGMGQKPANDGRAIPVAPVTTQEATPISTPWKNR